MKIYDYQKIKFGNDSQQPVLFEHLTEIHLNRSKYVITSYLNFDQYYKGFSQLEDFANKLLLKVTKLSKTEMPYFVRRYSDKQTVLEDIFKTHKQEVMSLIQTLEAHKYQFNKILDHMTTSTDINPDKQSRQVKQEAFNKIFNFLFGSGDDISETIKQIKNNLEILKQNQQSLENEPMKQLEMISESNIQISRNCVVLNILNTDLIQLNHSMNTVAEALKALKFSKNFLLAMLQVRDWLPCEMAWII